MHATCASDDCNEKAAVMDMEAFPARWALCSRHAEAAIQEGDSRIEALEAEVKRLREERDSLQAERDRYKDRLLDISRMALGVFQALEGSE